jgi:type VI secretion system protein ImpJ
MATHAVHWNEGLFLRPHHFQAMERQLRETIQLSENWNVGYAYGLRKIEINEDALLNWRVSVNSCEIRLHDGTHVRFPEGASLDPLVIPRDALSDSDQRLLVYLTLPRLRPGRKNADALTPEPDVRYRVDSMEVEDENQPGNAQRLEIRWPNIRLMIGEEEVAGYEALPIMRLRLGATAEAPPEIDNDYIPPVLACDAWPRLQELITRIYDQLSGTAERLAAQMIDRGVAFESGHREDFERIMKLQALNTALGYLFHLPYVRGIHPFTAYAELCRVVGLLAIFHPKRRMPAVPRYDHDDLGTCFRAIQQALQITDQQRAGYVKRPFVGAGLQMQVRLEREWLQPNWIFFIGVESKLSFTEVDRLLMQRLDMKVGSSEEVDTIYKFARAGVHLVPVTDPPRDFPQGRWTYWRVDRSSDPWQAVERTLNLGIRFNERQVEGKIDGEHRVQVHQAEGAELVGLAFALYAMPQAQS